MAKEYGLKFINAKTWNDNKNNSVESFGVTQFQLHLTEQRVGEI